MTEQQQQKLTIMTDEIVEKPKYCDPPCETRPMMGRSWWKSLGYGSPCLCAQTTSNIKEKEKMEKEKMEKEEWWKPAYNSFNEAIVGEFGDESEQAKKYGVGIFSPKEDCECGNNKHKGIVNGEMRCEDCDIDGMNYNGGLSETEEEEEEEQILKGFKGAIDALKKMTVEENVEEEEEEEVDRFTERQFNPHCLSVLVINDEEEEEIETLYSNPKYQYDGWENDGDHFLKRKVRCLECKELTNHPWRFNKHPDLNYNIKSWICKKPTCIQKHDEFNQENRPEHKTKVCSGRVNF